jgi:hypothetical protein
MKHHNLLILVLTLDCLEVIIGELRTKLASYGYDPGSFDNNVRTLKSDKLIGKIDWNISDNHTISKA